MVQKVNFRPADWIKHCPAFLSQGVGALVTVFGSCKFIPTRARDAATVLFYNKTFGRALLFLALLESCPASAYLSKMTYTLLTGAS